jgi:hypothetical protein
MAGFEPEAESSYAVVDIQAQKFTTNNFHFIKAAISPEDHALFEVLGNGSYRMQLACFFVLNDLART